MPLNLKLMIGAMLLILMIGGILAFGHRQYERGAADERHAQQTALEAEREARKKADWKVRNYYEGRIAELHARAGIERGGPAIHCVLHAPGEVRSGSDSAGPVEGAGGESAVRADADIRPELVRVGETCEAMRQQLIAIKARQDMLAVER
jgi:hypothetical protein